MLVQWYNVWFLLVPLPYLSLPILIDLGGARSHLRHRYPELAYVITYYTSEKCQVRIYHLPTSYVMRLVRSVARNMKIHTGGIESSPGAGGGP